jgi:hypothetical protein
MGYKRNLRQVLDAGYDLTNTEQDNSSNFTGFTTSLVNVLYTSFGYPPSMILLAYNQLAKDSGNNYPHQDGILVSGGGAYWNSSFTDVGLKHYHQQMQAMKGFVSMATDDNGSSPSVTAIEGVGNGNGTYKTIDISMGGMRGFEYSTTPNILWPSSAGVVETLYDSGEISIGDAS